MDTLYFLAKDIERFNSILDREAELLVLSLCVDYGEYASQWSWRGGGRQGDVLWSSSAARVSGRSGISI